MMALIEALVFDFDGVILESADIKSRAFRELFASYSDKIEAIVAYHEGHAGISRYDKFRYVYENILKLPLSIDEERVLGERFSNLVVQEILRCPFVPGALEFFSDYSHAYPLFIVSATPEDELEKLVVARNLRRFFRAIYGSPRRKSDCLAEILTVTGQPKGSHVLIGDATSDYEAAQAACIGFIGRVASGKRNPFQGLGVPVIADLFQLDGYLRGRVINGRGVECSGTGRKEA